MTKDTVQVRNRRYAKTVQKKSKQKVLLFSEEVAAEGDHAKQHLYHLLHHIDLPPKIVLSLFAISIGSNVETLIKLGTQDNLITAPNT